MVGQAPVAHPIQLNLEYSPGWGQCGGAGHSQWTEQEQTAPWTLKWEGETKIKKEKGGSKEKKGWKRKKRGRERREKEAKQGKKGKREEERKTYRPICHSVSLANPHSLKRLCCKTLPIIKGE